MRKDSKDLTEIFSVGSNDSNPSIKEIRRKKNFANNYFFIWKYICKNSKSTYVLFYVNFPWYLTKNII